MERIYWSASADGGKGGWHFESLSGARMIRVVDGAALAAALVSAEAIDAQDWQAFCAHMPDGEDLPDRRDFQANVTALLGDPPTQLVSNPDCRLPADAVEVDGLAYEQLMEDHCETGRPIVTDGGEPVLGDLPALAADEALVIVRKLRDAALARSDWTDLPGADLADVPRALWKKRRKALRDLPASLDFGDGATGAAVTKAAQAAIAAIFQQDDARD